MRIAFVLPGSGISGGIRSTQRFASGLLERGHILSSTIAFGLYFPVVALAVLRLRNKVPDWGRRWHMRLGITAFCFRTVGFMLMWAVNAEGV